MSPKQQKKPTLLQQRAVDSVVKQIAAQHGLESHKAFLFLVIERFLSDQNLNSIDIEASIVDGFDDCGVDAIVIDEDTEDQPRIYFFQSKYYTSENAFEKQFEGAALEKIQSAFDDFVLHGRINADYQNQRLVDKLNSVKNLGPKNPKFTIVLCSNSDCPSPRAKARLEEFINETNRSSAGDYISVEYLHLERIAIELIAPQQKVRVDTELQISGRYLTEDTGNVRLFVGAVEGSELANLVAKHHGDIFERNVRGYLKHTNSVNQNIIETATGKHSPYFVYMNNGLTITCDKYSHTPINNSPRLDIRNAQIVNRQQTAWSLFTASESNRLKDDVKVLVRIVETTDPTLLMQIVEATNSQTRVTSRDLHSNDHVQKLIEEHLASIGYFYEARKNKFSKEDTSKRIDAEIAAQAYFAIFSEQPAIAKDKKKLLFGESYDELFNDKTNPDDILYSFRVLKQVQRMNNDPRYLKKYTFLKDATLHIAALMHSVGVKTFEERVDLADDARLKALYIRVVRALSQLVKERRQQEKDKYEHRRTFKDTGTYGRAIEILESSMKKKKTPVRR